MSAALRRMRLLSASAVVSSAHPCRRLACFLIRVDGWMDGLQLRIVGWLATALSIPKSQHAEEVQQTDRAAAGQSLKPRNRETEIERERERMQAASGQSQTTDRSIALLPLCLCVRWWWIGRSWRDAAASFTLCSQADKKARPCPLSFSSKEARSDSTNDRHRSRGRVINAAGLIPRDE